MSLFKLLFSGKSRNLRNLLMETRRYCPPDDPFLGGARNFSYIFYTHGFLGVNQPPAFPNAYKNISTEVFRKTYASLFLYFGLRRGIGASPFTNHDEFVDALSKKFPYLDRAALKYLDSEWNELTPDQLNSKLCQFFSENGVFKQVFTASDTEIEEWVKNFTNQTYDYVQQQNL
jgi:hypothetical protein